MNIILFDQPPEDGKLCISRKDPRGKHITHILRAAVGDSLLMGLINGSFGRAVITAIDAEYIHVLWDPRELSSPLYPLELLVAQIRPICMKRILREAASLGVQKIHVTGADTAEKSYADAHLWSRGEYTDYLIHGAQQAVSTRIPELNLYGCVDEIPQNSAAEMFFLDPDADLQALSGYNLKGRSDPVILAEGPERGRSDRERELFVRRGFIPARLGSRILRTETASSVGIGIALHAMGYL
ncbi:MAG: RsmE family RNA methyltransferase [Spirochaetales bacterium]|jgi:16S rRNA (uracil1498-N3)-methyltransferase|nr:RsmE family RNA methyltransferase [Spirochaetales bacterium]